MLPSWFRLTLSCEDLEIHKILDTISEQRWNAHVVPSFAVENGIIVNGAIITLHDIENSILTIADVWSVICTTNPRLECAFLETSDESFRGCVLNYPSSDQLD